MIYELRVGYNYDVDVTFINDPKSFFVRAAYIDDLLMSIEKPGLSVSVAEVQLDRTFIYKSNTLKKFVRGKVRHYETKNGEVKFHMFAIDYGCIDVAVALKDIYHLDEEADPQNQCPGLAIHCQLHFCEPIGKDFSDKVVDTMKHFVGSQTASINVTATRGEQLVVELMTVNCPRDVASMLVLLDLTQLTKRPNTVNVPHSTVASNLTTKLKYNHKKLKVGDILHVRMQSGSSVSGFYVADVNDFKKLKYGQPAFSLHCKSRCMKDEDFEPGKPCAVKLDNLGQYERAIIKEVRPDSKAVLQLVDWGKELETSFSSVRSIGEFYLKQPKIAIYCSTTEDQVWESTLPSFFFKGYELGVKIMELGDYSDKPHKVNIYPMSMIKY